MAIDIGDNLNIKATCIHCCVYVICSQLNSLFCPNKLFGMFIANCCPVYVKHAGTELMAADAGSAVPSSVPASVDAN